MPNKIRPPTPTRCEMKMKSLMLGLLMLRSMTVTVGEPETVEKSGGELLIVNCGVISASTPAVITLRPAVAPIASLIFRPRSPHGKSARGIEPIEKG